MHPGNPFLSTYKKSPLTLDRLLEGRPIAAQNSSLLNLPVEILSEIVKYIETDKSSLASLALVNSDCRQLARSCQFRDVLIDFSPRSSYILGVLIREATERMRTKDRLTRRPALGACVRYMTTNLTHYWKERKAMRPKISEGEASTDRAAFQQWMELSGNVSTRIDHVYDPSLLLVITTLPHLEILDWDKVADINPYFLDSLGASTVKHLKFEGNLDSDNMAMQLEDGASWPLLSLDIHVKWDFGYRWERETVDASPFWNGLFQACCSTLRILKCTHIQIHRREDKAISFNAHFPHLQFLFIQYDMPISQPSLISLLQSPRLSTLVINIGDSITVNAMDQVGYLRSLETLVWNGVNLPATLSLRSLEHNSQLKKFGILWSQSPSLLERIVPALTSCYNLKTLSLIWDEKIISSVTLMSLSRLSSLEELHISAGHQTGWRHNWFVDHNAIRNILAPLRKLKIFLISRDSYQINKQLPNAEENSYYDYRVPSGDDYIEFMEQQQSADDGQVIDSLHDVWEKLHLRRMTQQAEKYAAVFLELQWIYIGQLVFTFLQCPDGQQVTVSSSAERKPDFPIYETLFGVWSK
ncbi:hypothetical protein EYB25_009531 [Talaromyces marneffei]|nr:hypothetical protein EYB25_009531 [Talaromyces marneffei]